MTESPPDWLVHHPALAARAISLESPWCQAPRVWRTVEDVEGNWDAPCYVVKVLVPGSVEAPVYELLASDGLAHAHIIPAEVVRDERSDFLLMPALLDPFAIPRRWDTEEVLDFCHQVLQGIEDLHAVKIAHLDIHEGNVLMATSYEATRHANTKAGTIYLIDFGSSRVLARGPGEQEPIELPPSAVPKFADRPVFDPYAWDMYCVGVLFTSILEVSNPIPEQLLGSNPDLPGSTTDNDRPELAAPHARDICRLDHRQ
ncbi:hypothetical protein K466DRAFT_606522 [Polyporus arcularius HHB13444]|uniref:Protein kinase domain-containing protein n=1 Tax=Polyporus arcularius HHB13444 TaxID=1314778 RepID=A0A5C3NNV8_9APHY|nr:hypothetical protein K466DRAFT_606522 [Polyporus arcularius HHB13444]